nr:hypothetical protein [Pyrinomonadaceae bacterium]
DSLNENGKHLKDVKNLYNTNSFDPLIGASITITPKDAEAFVKSATEYFEKRAKTAAAKADSPPTQAHAKPFKPKRNRISDLPNEILIWRNLEKRKYHIEGFSLGDLEFDHIFCAYLVKAMPFILYFDDFRDSIEERVEIVKDDKGNFHGWLEIVETLFQKTDQNFSVFKLKTMEERARKSVLAQVKKKLNVKHNNLHF